MKIKTLSYTVLFQKEPEGGYTAFVPTLPGCVTYGNDLTHAKNMVQEAIELYIESLKAHHEEVPSENEVFYSQIQINPKSSASYA